MQSHNFVALVCSKYMYSTKLFRRHMTFIVENVLYVVKPQHGASMHSENKILYTTGQLPIYKVRL